LTYSQIWKKIKYHYNEIDIMKILEVFYMSL
jgi:hypothetical protein